MMTPEELAEELKSLHYTEKLILAKKLIEYAYEELGNLSQQLAPKRETATTELPAKKQTIASPTQKTEKKQDKTEQLPEEQDTPQKSKAATAKQQDEIISFNDLVSRLQTQKCKKEATLINAIINLYQYKGEISIKDAKKIVTRLKQKKVISIDDKGVITWN